MAKQAMTRDIVSSYLSSVKPLIDNVIYDNVRGSPEDLYNASLHLVKAGGKRVRPAVTVAFSRMISGYSGDHAALLYGAAVEVLHTFTLIHDDIMDEDEKRRGVPTVHMVWGTANAILAGDLLYAYSMKLAAEATRSLDYYCQSIDPLTLLSEATIKVSEGQAMDMMFEKADQVAVDDYLTMVYLKTGALLEASAGLGVIAGRGDCEDVWSAMLYGRLVGIAFQIRDDYLGVFGDPEKTGKPKYSDLARGKKTLLLLYTIENAGRDRVEKLLAEERYEELAKLMEDVGAVDYAMNMARSLARDAAEIVDSIYRNSSGELDPDEDEGSDDAREKSRSFLKALAYFVVEREK